MLKNQGLTNGKNLEAILFPIIFTMGWSGTGNEDLTA
jgi:hypothetical protein